MKTSLRSSLLCPLMQPLATGLRSSHLMISWMMSLASRFYFFLFLSFSFKIFNVERLNSIDVQSLALALYPFQLYCTFVCLRDSNFYVPWPNTLIKYQIFLYTG